MSDILLPTAYSKSQNRYFHISEGPFTSMDLECPYCHTEVYGKTKGEERRPHFCHNSKQDCKPTSETLLHDGAKVFLYNSLKSGLSQDIIVEEFSKLPQDIANVVKFLSIRQLRIPTRSLPGFSFAEHELETQTGQVRPDISSFDGLFNTMFAWEIFVTHKIEERKCDYFAENNIPFIELKPKFVEPYGYEFYLESCGGFNLSNQGRLLEFLFQTYKVELLSIYRGTLSADDRETQLAAYLQEARSIAEREASELFDSYVSEYHEKLQSESQLQAQILGKQKAEQLFNEFIAEYKDQLLSEAFSNAEIKAKKEAEASYNRQLNEYKSELWQKAYSKAREKLLLDLKQVAKNSINDKMLDQTITESDVYSRLIDKMCLEIYETDYQPSEILKTEVIKNVKMKAGEQPSIEVNIHRFIRSPIRLLTGFVNSFVEHFSLTALLNQKNQVVGFDFIFCSTKQRIILDGEKVAYDNIGLLSLSVCRGKNGYYCQAISASGDKFTVISHLQLLFELLLHASHFFKCDIVLDKNKKGYFSVVGIRIPGIINKRDLNNEISKFCAETIEEMFDLQAPPNTSVETFSES